MTVEAKSRVTVEGPPEEVHAPGEIAEHLEQVLISPPFRTSRQCKELLRYLVKHSQGADDGSLRERVIGMQVFGREASYDTNEDPVVRIRAADVRKRLAQFYQSQGSSGSSLHLDLVPGSYRVHFRHAAPMLPPGNSASKPGSQAPSAENFRPWKDQGSEIGAFADATLSASHHTPEERSAFLGWALAGVVLAVIFAMGVLVAARTRTNVQQQFWAPVTGTEQPVLVYLGANMAYIFSPEFLAQYRAGHYLPNNGPEFPVDLSAMKSVPTKDLLPVQDTFVTTADLSAAVALTSQLRDWKKPFVLRVANDLSIAELRDRPTVLVGGFNNPWTLQLTKSLPFSFREGTTIQERDGAKRSWSVDPHSQASTQEDYALITRLLHSATGGPSIAVAGIGQYGTQAAAELLTTPDKVRGLLQGAPKNWERGNVQFLLRVKILQFQPVSTEIVAEKVW